MWLTEDEKKLTTEYLKNGYCIKKINNLNILDKIMDIFVDLAEETTGKKCLISKIDYLNKKNKLMFKK